MVRPVAKTRRPSSASAVATPRPTPRLAPVTSATCPSRLIMVWVDSTSDSGDFLDRLLDGSWLIVSNEYSRVGHVADDYRRVRGPHVLPRVDEERLCIRLFGIGENLR